MDPHIGWHALLRQAHLWTHCPVETLALISTVGLFTLLGWSALAWLKRPEAWLITLVLMLGVQPAVMGRFMLGRPLLLSMSALVTILFLWQARGSAPPDKRACVVMTGCIALAVLLHGVWYLWALPVAAFFLARQYHWASALAVCWVAGTMLGALGTGRPLAYLSEAARLASGALGPHAPQSTLVGEFQPASGNWLPLLLMGGLLLLRQSAKLPAPPLRAHPAFWLACLGWVLGFRAERFWDDWGLPALMVLLALDLDLLLQTRLAAHGLQRLALAGALALTLFLATTNDAGSRWSASAGWEYLTAEDPHLAGWLPEAGGILYESDMELFYHTFFKNPTAPWRYTAGFEPVLMPPDDLNTYQQILQHFDQPDVYQPWIQKMRPTDRLVLSSRSNPSSFLPDLEWKHAVGILWLGRLPRKT
jgi:hypothetical protein